MNAAGHPQGEEPREAEVSYAPLDADSTFHVTATIAGVTGELEIRASKVSTIQRTMRLLKQNGLLHPEGTRQPQPQAHGTNGATPPLCPVHNRAMKPSKKPGAWFCSAKVDEGYCDQKVG